ncbi:hypothetical protein D3C73_1282610 [compost metagenome]
MHESTAWLWMHDWQEQKLRSQRSQNRVKSLQHTGCHHTARQIQYDCISYEKVQTTLMLPQPLQILRMQSQMIRHLTTC